MGNRHFPLIFDFDGVLADSAELVYDVMNEALVRNGYPGVSFEEFCSLSKSDLLDRYQLSSWQKIRLFRWCRKQILNKRVDIFLGVHQAIRFDLAGHSKWIASSNSEKFIRAQLRHVHIEHHFEKIRAGFYIGGKAKFLKKISGLYITDEVRDVNECHQAGMDVIAVSWGLDSEDALRSAKPRAIAQTPKELVLLIKDYLEKRRR